MTLDPRLLGLLVCPATRTPLRHVPAAGDPNGGWLVSDEAGLAYPVSDGIPVLLLEEAKPWPLADAG